MSNETPNFLIVDDDPQALDIIKTLVNSLGCECECVSSSEDVLTLVKEPSHAKQFDAIFIDVLMPNMNGLELAKALSELPHTENIPRVMVSALGKYDDILRGYQAGSDYYITKPVDRDQLIYALDLIFQDLGDGQDRHELPEA